MKSVWVGIGMVLATSTSLANCLSLPTKFLNNETKQEATVVACARPFNSVTQVLENVRVQIGETSYPLSSKTEDKIVIRLSKEFCHDLGGKVAARPFAFSGRIFAEKSSAEKIILTTGYNPEAKLSTEETKPLSHFFCTDVHR